MKYDHDNSEECKKYGGHCWVGGQVSYQTTWETVKWENCKHCPATRKLTSQSPWQIEEYNA